MIVGLIALTLSACGQSENHANVANAPQAHDHFHSHEGETIDLGAKSIAALNIAVVQKGKPHRGGTLYLEIHFSGTEIDIGRVVGDIVDAEGTVVVATGFHPMAQKGRYGAHAVLPANAPKGLKFRISHRDIEPAQVAEFAIKE